MYSKKSNQITSKVFVCNHPNCNKAFTTKFSLRRHQLIHTGEKPFGCQYCGKKFSLAQSMKEHLFGHTKERPYICGISNCKSSFRHLSELSMHRRVHPEYKPRKYHYLSTNVESSGEKTETRKFAIITTRVPRGKIAKLETNCKDVSVSSGNEDATKESYRLDMKFLNYLVQITQTKGEIERPRLPVPGIAGGMAIVDKE